jgi:hypothetical protein
MMKTDLAAENPAAPDMLRPEKNDRSGVGVHYVDAWLKPVRAGVLLADGRKFSVKRRGLKVTMALGSEKSHGLLRRLDNGPTPVEMLRGALDEAGAQLGVTVTAADGRLWLEH